MRKILLLTGTIAPDEMMSNRWGGGINFDPINRLNQYLTALDNYSSMHLFDKIYFIENSKYECQLPLN